MEYRTSPFFFGRPSIFGYCKATLKGRGCVGSRLVVDQGLGYHGGIWGEIGVTGGEVCDSKPLSPTYGHPLVRLVIDLSLISA